MSSAELSPTELTHTADAGRTDGSRRAVSVRRWLPIGSLTASVLVVAALFAAGAWERRWIADDGLIVLRTVRNLLAGNGPVFNEGERVEANTSTAWTYLIWLFTWMTGGKPEYVVLWIALVLSVLALPIAMIATARLYRVDRLRSWAMFLPFGALIYIALPPARDFATSGLEVSLCLFWAAVLWSQLVSWSAGPRRTRGREITLLLLLGFNAGLSPLIRPELALVGALVLALVFFSRMPSWWVRVAFVIVAAVVPVGYQIFRMGYYGLLVPNTAVAKDASGSKWSQGWTYVTNMFGPYVLLLPVLVAVLAGLALWAQWRKVGVDSTDTDGVDAGKTDTVADATDHGSPARLRRVLVAGQSRLRSRGAVVVVMVVAGLAEAVYWVHQGGDFMHARVLLAPLFLMLLPVMVIPLSLRPGRDRAAVLSTAATGVLGIAWIVLVVWGVITVNSHGLRNGTDIGRSGIVDERRYYAQNLGIEHPLTAEDYRQFARMQPMVDAIEEHQADGGVLLSSGDYDTWYYVPQIRGTHPTQLTVYFLNLGMTSMNAPLSVRVVDQMGLAYPLAAHTHRLPDARIGHDKDLDPEWVVADSRAVPYYPELPRAVSQSWTLQARAALRCPATKELIESYTGPMTWARFKQNLRDSRQLTAYRFNRIPYYALQECGLPNPVPGASPIRRFGK